MGFNSLQRPLRRQRLRFAAECWRWYCLAAPLWRPGGLSRFCKWGV